MDNTIISIMYLHNRDNINKIYEIVINKIKLEILRDEKDLNEVTVLKKINIKYKEKVFRSSKKL
ncbi:hypothetical protein [Metaclostridioides mangenotii]|uniref:hypothetical protein n=1 Tax=Metaclostridioides mangenotii TaxID=1540 RepID=UPI0016399F34|nr:hypothetical protein [Clostridioides mangenotii]